MAKEIQFQDSTGEKYYPLPSWPIGTVIITSSNTNPSVYYGGTWELIDKEFKNFSNTYSSTEVSKIATSENATVTQVVVQRVGHTIVLRVGFETKIELNDNDINLFTLNLSELGVVDFRFGAYFITIPVDNKDGIIIGSLESNGVVLSSDVIMKGNATVMPSGANASLFIERNVHSAVMLDEACDKFYWKRTG